MAAAHAAGHRDFGENYVQELAEKGAASADVEGLRWHFIGSLQSNKVRQLCGVPNLACVHTVERAKIANALDRVWGELRPDAAPLAVFVQVNTSGEDSKGGCAPADAPALCETVQACERLTLTGLMCIGKHCRRADISLMSRGGAAAATRLFRGDESRCRGCDVDVLWRPARASGTQAPRATRRRTSKSSRAAATPRRRSSASTSRPSA